MRNRRFYLSIRFNRRSILTFFCFSGIILVSLICLANFFAAQSLDYPDARRNQRRIQQTHQYNDIIRRQFQDLHNGRRDKILSLNIDITKSERLQALKLQKAKMTAVAIEEQGVALSEAQKELLKNMKSSEKDFLRKNVKNAQLKQEQALLIQLKRSGLIKSYPGPGGGEYIQTTPQLRVRFPTSVKNQNPKDWPKDHKVFFNLTHHPFITPDSCKNYTTSFALPGSLQTSALASFPSSGNSWLRYLIDCLSGIFTGSMYRDTSLAAKGLYGESVKYDSGMTILQKTHGFTIGNDKMHLPLSKKITHNDMEELSHRGVLIFRNPFKALISHRNLDVGGHTGYAPKSHFEGVGWREFIELKIKLWKEFYTLWLEYSKKEDIYVVFYEELKSDASRILREMLHFLSMPVDESRLTCLLNSTQGPFLRKPPGVKQFVETPFEKDTKDLIYEAIYLVDEVLLKKGKRALPKKYYEFYDPVEAQLSVAKLRRNVV